MSIVNGVGAPQIQIKKLNGSTVTINLPVPELNSEEPGAEVVVHSAFDFEDIVDQVGFKPRWTISYETFIDGLKLLELRHLLEKNQEIILVPHSDLPGRKFPVRLLNSGELSRRGYGGPGLETTGHKGLRLVFECTEVLDAIPFPQAGLTGRTWTGFGSETWANHTGTVWHFMR